MKAWTCSYPVLYLAFALSVVTVNGATFAWSSDSMPNPSLDPSACGRPDVQTGRSRICDPDRVLSTTSRDVVEGIIQDVESGREPYATMNCEEVKIGWKVAVAVVQRMQMAPASIPADVAENFATELHDRWGVGDAACHNGVLLLLAVQDRQVYISTGKGAMAALPDKSVQNVLAKMRPELRQGRYDEAVEQAVVLMGLLLAGGDLDDEDGGGYDWALIAALSVMATLLGGTCYSATKRNAEYRTCKNLLVKLRRDQQTALANRRYDITSCPICMEDFKGDAKPVHDEAAVQADTKPISTPGSVSTDSLQDGAPLLPPTKDAVTVTERKAERTASGSNAPNQPLVLPCGHCFCDACIAKWLEIASNLTCPVCRKHIREDDSRDNSRRDVRNDGRDGGSSSSSAQPLPQCSATENDAYDALFVPDARFRLAQLHARYPYFVSSTMVDTWGTEMTDGAVMSTLAQIDAQMTSTAHAAHAQNGSIGATSDFGGGSSFGGGGGGSSW